METEVLDYIHEYIKVDPDDIPVLETESVEGQLKRLEKLHHLGLISKIYRLARHNKLEHAYGTYWLCRLVEKATTGLKLDEKALRLSAMLHSIGHLPFSYSVEHSVLQLYHIHPQTKNWLDNLFKECIDFVNEPGLEKFAKDILLRNNSYTLYRWFSSAKIARSKGFANELGKSIVRHLVYPQSFGYQLLREVDRLDYVLRDILYLGLGRIEPNITLLLAQFGSEAEGLIRKPPLFEVIDAAQRWLNKEVYMDGRVRCLAQVVGKSILSEVIDGQLAIEELLEMNDDDMTERLKTFKSCPTDINSLVGRIEAGKLVEIARVKCEGGCLVDREAQIAGTKKTKLHDYPQKKGIYLDCLPFWDMVGEDLLSIGIAYDLDSGQIENLVGAFLRAEGRVPESLDSVELSYREDVIHFILGLSIRPQFERYRGDVWPTLLRHMGRVTQDVKELLPEEWEDKLKLWHERWEMREEASLEVAFGEKRSEWLAKHFLRFPEHFATEVIRSVLRSIEQLRRRRGESSQMYATRKERLLEYASYLEAIVKMRIDSRMGWVLPCVKLIDESGRERWEIDCISLSVPSAHHGPVRLELSEVSAVESTTKELEVRRKLEMVIHAVKERFPRGIELVARFNGRELPGLSS